MKIKELINKFTDEQIINTLIKLYPDQEKNRKGYKKVLEELRKKRLKNTDIKIILQRNKKYTSVSGIDNKGKIWGIEYTQWGEWVNMEIEERTLKNYRKINIIAHCLWEMTWAGFSDKKVKREAGKLFNRFAKC